MSDDPIRFSQLCNFFEKQLEACKTSDQYQYTLYGGSRGPGKSYWLRWNCLRLLLKYAAEGLRGVRGGLFCNSYTDLRDRQIANIAMEFPAWLGELRESQEYGLGYHIKPEFGGGVILLRNLDDPAKYRSAEFAFIAIDELTLTRFETFNLLRGSLRWPGIAKPRFFAATNPGGLGHAWVKSLWIDRNFPPEMEKIKDEFAFVKALPTDNKHLDSSYWEMLETLTPDLARAWRYGDWDVFEGQYFSELRREIHGFRGSPPRGWTFRCLDYGEHSPSAVYWCRVDHDGVIWVYRELYGSGYTFSALAEKIIEMSVNPEDGSPEQIRYTVTPPDMWAKRLNIGSEPVSGAEIFAAHGIPSIKARDDRIMGWRRMREMLQAPVSLRIHLDNCKHFWRTVPTLVHDPHNPEDVDTDGEDHAADAIRYGLATRHMGPALHGWGYRREIQDEDDVPEKKERTPVTGY